MPGSPVADIRNSFGAAFVGLLVSTTLFGLIIVQTWLYFWHYRNRDPKALKFFVAFITVMEALDTILCAYAIYWYLVLNFGNVESLDYIMWAMNIQVAIGPAAVVGVCVQIYYARRVYLVSQSIICPILIVALVAISFSFELFFAIEESALKRFSKFHSLLWGPCVGITAAVSAELLIAAAMCWSLYRKRTGDARTDSIITTLMAYSVNSGLLTSLLGTAALISFAVSPSSMIFVACLWVMGKCGVNSLLAM
ncbi:hypothetical protein BJY52DRAFT_1312400 [Lactarius psammicola]|nr:hypothetical protein BJY52DRAFT_1312400 [Lactarius psammicola]